jgi:hypothetical protein
VSHGQEGEILVIPFISFFLFPFQFFFFLSYCFFFSVPLLFSLVFFVLPLTLSLSSLLTSLPRRCVGRLPRHLRWPVGRAMELSRRAHRASSPAGRGGPTGCSRRPPASSAGHLHHRRHRSAVVSAVELCCRKLFVLSARPLISNTPVVPSLHACAPAPLVPSRG